MNKFKIALCCTAKLENNYIFEFVEHYKSLGFDKIFIYDNNNPEDEIMNNILQDFINDNFVEIIDKRGQGLTQADEYKECYLSHSDEYEWFAFFDIDEFLELPAKKEIHKFLEQEKFNIFNCIRINWVMYGDNGVIYNNSYNVQDTFKKPLYDPKKYYENTITKCILRRNIPNFEWSMNIPYANAHTPKYVLSIIACNTNGEVTNRDEAGMDKILLDDAYLKHYRFKSLSEFMLKKQRGFADFKNYPSKLNWKKDILEFFGQNECTQEKLKFIFDRFDLILKDEYKLNKIKKHSIALICTHKNHIKIAPFVIDYWKKFVTHVYVFDNGSTDGSLENFKKYDWITVQDISQYTGGELNDNINVQIKNSMWKNLKFAYDYVICCDFDECPYCEDWNKVLTHLDDLNAALIYPKHCNMISNEFIEYDENKLYHKLNPYCEDLNRCGMFELRRRNRCYIINPKLVEEINYLPGQEFCCPIAENMTPYYVNNINIFHLHYIGNAYAEEIRIKNIETMSELNKKQNLGYHLFNEDVENKINKLLEHKVKYNEVKYPSYKDY